MENWKFLLQKEGDRSWLPLDSPDVEILEGRYRIVARSNQVNTEVEVRISHLTIGEDPPKRRIQKRSNRTNQDGLMVVIPFTRLKPGIWELCCSSIDLMSDLLGDSWQYAVKLQVLARAAEGEEWEPEWSPTETTVSITEGVPHFVELSEVEVSATSPVVASTDQPEADLIPAEAVASSPLAAASVTTVESPASTVEPPASTVEPPATTVESPASIAETPADPANQPVPLSPEVAEILGASMDRLFQIAEQMSNQLVDEVLRDFDLMPPLEDAPPTEVNSSEIQPSSDELTSESVGAQSAEAQSAEAPSVESDPEALTVENADLAATGYLFNQETALSLKLDQEAFVACRGERLTLSGQVEVETLAARSGVPVADEPFDQSVQYFASDIADPWDPNDALELVGATAQELQIYLRDPQSLQVLVSDRRSLPDQSPPFPFSFSFVLPEEGATHLLLGEVLLCGTLPTRQGALSTLMSQAFTITLDPKELVGELTKLSGALDETLADRPEEEDRLDLPLELSNYLEKEKEKELSLTLSFLDPELAEIPPVEEPSRFASLAGQPLPPQIYRPDPAQLRSRPLELPEFSELTNQADELLSAAVAEAVSSQTEQEDTTLEQELFSLPEDPESMTQTQVEAVGLPTSLEATKTPDQLELEPVKPPASLDDSIVESSTTIVESSTTDLMTADSQVDFASPDSVSELEPPPDLPAAPNSVADSIENPDEEPVPVDLPSPIQLGFQALKLQDRFLTRLSSLANDAELSAWLRSQLGSKTSPPEPKDNPKAVAEAERIAKEVVVDDEPGNGSNRRRTSPKQLKAEPSTPDEDEPNVLILPKDEPIPMPKLEVANGELVAGALVNIRVKLPNLIPRMYVKLWVTDRQTRSLLDGPRWLLDFLPNGLGDMEAFTQLTVPFGSLEIRFEAIAIEMHTQRESHKTSVERDVVPPDLPVMSLDDFNA
jgi:hypothetical protein